MSCNYKYKYLIRYLILNFKNDQGLTLIEILVIIVILGIMAAVASPNLLPLLQRTKANQAAVQLKTILQSAQANANRLSKSCDVTLDSTASDFYTFTSTTPGCVSESVTIEKDSIIITTNGSGTVTFKFTGETDVGSAQTFTISRKNSAGNADLSSANCLVISSGLGLFRSGKYDSSAPSNCLNVENLRYDNEN